MSVPIIIPVLLDEAGLNMCEFRVLMHLHRRAGIKRRCWPSAVVIARSCGLAKTTVLKQLKALEQRGAIVRHRKNGIAGQIELVPLETWAHTGQRRVPVHSLGRSSSQSGTGPPDGPKRVKGKNTNSHTENGAGGGQVLEEPKLPEQTSSGPSKRKTDPRHPLFVDGYANAFRKRVGAAYVCQPRDFKSLSQLLKAAPALTLENFLRLFQSARDAAESSFAGWQVKQSASLHGFCVHYSEIQAALARPPPRLYPARPAPATLY